MSQPNKSYLIINIVELLSKERTFRQSHDQRGCMGNICYNFNCDKVNEAFRFNLNGILRLFLEVQFKCLHSCQSWNYMDYSIGVNCNLPISNFLYFRPLFWEKGRGQPKEYTKLVMTTFIDRNKSLSIPSFRFSNLIIPLHPVVHLLENLTIQKCIVGTKD